MHQTVRSARDCGGKTARSLRIARRHPYRLSIRMAEFKPLYPYGCSQVRIPHDYSERIACVIIKMLLFLGAIRDAGRENAKVGQAPKKIAEGVRTCAGYP